ncbi:MAG: hypothetical protein ACN4GR_15130 [Arenicellales bacterium]
MIEKAKLTHSIDVEFMDFSQLGNDGYIQCLIVNIHFHHLIFMEFGVEDHSEFINRFLMVANNWSGLVFDWSQSNVAVSD